MRRQAMRPRRGAATHHADQVAGSSQRFGRLRRGQQRRLSRTSRQGPHARQGSRACSTSSAAALRFSYSLSDKLRSVAGDSHGDIGPCIVQRAALGAAAPARARARHGGTSARLDARGHRYG